MPIIHLSIQINAPIERCFDLARSIDLHKLSTKDTREEAVDGVKEGLINKGEWVTWRARHLGVMQTLTSKITEFQYPYHFRDEMVKGAFKMIRHDHFFTESGGSTTMRDELHFESPGWFIGTWFNKIFLTRYLTTLLEKRNQVIKQVAENDDWKEILK